MPVKAQVKKNTITTMTMMTMMMTMIGGGIYSSEMEINRII